MSDDRPVVGVDLGGTKVLSAVIDAGGHILSRAKMATEANTGVDRVIDRIAQSVRDAVEAAGRRIEDVAGVTVASPGPLDTKTGVVIDAPNLGGWRNVPLSASMEERLHVPAFVENDVDAGTLGEFEYGAGRGAQSVIGVFVGTGIGGGVIIDGKLVEGAAGISGEIGHVIVRANGARCGCGLRGCMEAYASRKAIARQILKAVQKGRDSVLADLVQQDIMRITSGKLRRAWEAGDKVTRKALKRSCRYLGVGIGSVINLLSPEVVVMGGGVYEALGEQLAPLATRQIEQNAMEACLRNVRIVLAELGDDAVVLGAAVMTRRRLAGERGGR